ncbi:Kinesin-like protein [Seminavis robusta]|uniref:Kinesin-like protein n=1 Tax=Seminavis robusta TaxID=568900 RepID=A0A9N8HVD7_9STRA|nr:Kinesin-like protein [Seminavis robusta]|eukprot:Sro1925_g305820.1 Kinesin-like protein (1032) ;mRNA; r:13923-17402
MPLASARGASEKRTKELQEEKARREKRERVDKGRMSLPRTTTRSTTRVGPENVKRRRQAREASEERMKKQIKAPPAKAKHDETMQLDDGSIKENIGSPTANVAPADPLPISSPTPYWKAVQGRRKSQKFSPRETRSAKKKKKSQEIDEHPIVGGGTALVFSPPDQKQNAIREKEELETKLQARDGRVSAQIEEGKYLEFSPTSFKCRNRNFDEMERERRAQNKNNDKPPMDKRPEADESFDSIQGSDAGVNDSSRSHVSGITTMSTNQNDEVLRIELKTINEKLDSIANENRRNSDAGLMLQQQGIQQTLEKERSALEAERANTKRLETSKANLESKVSSLENKLVANQEEFEAEKKRRDADMESCKGEHSRNVEELKGEIAALQQEKQEHLQEIDTLEAKLKEAKAFLSTNEADSKQIEQQMAQIETLKGVEQKHLKTQQELKNVMSSRAQLEAEVKRLEGDLKTYKENAADLEYQLKDALALVQQNEAEYQKEIQARDTTINDLMERVKSLRQEKDDTGGELDKIRRASEAKDKQISDLKAALEAAKQKHKETRESFSREKDDVENSLANLKNALETSTMNLRKAQLNEVAKQEECQQKDERIAELERQISKCKRRLSTSDDREDELLRKLQRSDQIRVELHNKVTQLSGNIRVFVRVRPSIPGEDEKLKKALEEKTKTQRKTKVQPSNESPFNFPGQLEENESKESEDLTKRVIEIKEPAKDRGGLSDRRKVWRYPFDNVYSPSSAQEDVWEGVAPLIQSAIDGFPVCIFAYGQTGSGKTHTMLGEPGNEGVICRAVNKMFAAKRELEEFSRGTTEVDMSVELLEIYNEQVRDLLVPNAGPNGRECTLKITSNEVVGNIRVPADSEEQVMKVLALAQSRRCVKATNSNAESSRSHMVFTLHFNVAMKNGIKRSGRLNICDLAGSERLGKSGANTVVKGDLMKETKAINSSLSVLSNVIEKLQAGSSSIPYRESKLTFLLQNSLGGNSKTLAIVCCNPHAAHFHESLCSIRFAEKVNKVELKAMANFSC